MKVFDPERIRYLRKLRGYSLGMLARLVGMQSRRKITRSAISHWEQGKAKPSLESLAALSEVFDVPLDYFFIRQSNCLFEKTPAASQEKEQPKGPLPLHREGAGKTERESLNGSRGEE